MITFTDSQRHKIRYWGAEFAANPGTSKREYLEDIALTLGYDGWFKVPFDIRGEALRLFQKGVDAERKNQREREKL